MHKCYLGLLLCFFQYVIVAQQADSLTQNKTNNFSHFLKNKNIGCTGFTGFDVTPTMESFQKQIRLDISLTHERLSLGMTYSSLLEGLKQYVIFPSTYRLNAQHGGIILGILIFKSNWSNGYVNTAYQWGQMVWEDTASKEYTFSSKSIGIKPEFEITIYPKFWLQLSAKVGYQQIRKLELPQVNPADFFRFFL